MTAVTATEKELEKAEELLAAFLQGMPEISLNLAHPQLNGVEISSEHDYIRESFGNFLESIHEPD